MVVQLTSDGKRESRSLKASPTGLKLKTTWRLRRTCRARRQHSLILTKDKQQGLTWHDSISLSLHGFHKLQALHWHCTGWAGAGGSDCSNRLLLPV